MDCSPPGSSVHGILQARVLEWVAMPSSRGLPDPGIEPESPSLLHRQAGSLPLAPPRKRSFWWFLALLGLQMRRSSLCLHPPMAFSSKCSLLFFSFKYLFIYLAVPSLSCSMSLSSCSIWGPVPQPGIRRGPATLGVQSLSHWTTREVPPLFLIRTPVTGLRSILNPAWFYVKIFFFLLHCALCGILVP